MGEVRQVVTGMKKAIAMKTIERFFVMGQRGIGKSSLCKYAVNVAERDLAALGLHVFLGGVTTLEEMAQAVLLRLLNESMGKAWYGKVLEFLGTHVKQVGLFGFTVQLSPQEQTQAVRSFLPMLRNLLAKLSSDKTGLLLVLDDLNGLADVPAFANWIKSFVDENATAREPLPIALVLAGLPERRQQMLANQPSLDRVFDPIRIDPFNEAETRDFYTRAFEKVKVPVEEAALKGLWFFSRGYPAFMHEIGDAVLKADTDDRIGEFDVAAGVVAAADVVGRKYLEPKVLDVIRSEKYRRILHKLGDPSFLAGFERRAVLAGLPEEEAGVFDNFLRRMEKLGAIRKIKERAPGTYEFTSLLYTLFFIMQTARTRPSSHGQNSK
jgi:hypothetical protein